MAGWRCLPCWQRPIAHGRRSPCRHPPTRWCSGPAPRNARRSRCRIESNASICSVPRRLRHLQVRRRSRPRRHRRPPVPPSRRPLLLSRRHLPRLRPRSRLRNQCHRPGSRASRPRRRQRRHEWPRRRPTRPSRPRPFRTGHGPRRRTSRPPCPCHLRPCLARRHKRRRSQVCRVFGCREEWHWRRPDRPPPTARPRRGRHSIWPSGRSSVA